MFNGQMGDDWKWLPLLLLVAAIAFLFFDPLGMKGSQVTYVINPVIRATPTPIPLPPVVPPGGPPPGGPPPIAGYPTYDTTGPKTAPQTPYAGGAIVNQSNVVLDGYIFSDCVQVVGDNITIRNSRFQASCNGAPMVWLREGVNLIVEDSEFVGLKAGTGLPSAAVTCSSCTVQRNRVRGTIDGFDPNGTAQIIGNYVGQLGGGIVNGAPTQNAGFRVADGAGVLIQNNSIEHDCGISRTDSGGAGGCTASAIFQPFCAGCSIGGATLDNNYFRKWNGTTGSVTTVVTSDNSLNIKVNNNIFGDTPVAFCTLLNGGTITEWTNNKREDGTAVAKSC
ncbi:hypothetical protein HYS00_03245 [Candidatus Microgenomates bacterium]|nr:hypothetical protein [Candidatus Microgenomates bacterium]